MGLISLITLKADIKKVFSADNFAKLKLFLEEQIIAYVNKADLKGTQKKAEVDAAAIAFIKEHFASKNTYVNLLVNLLISFEPTISQYVYDLLAAYVAGLTADVKAATTTATLENK